MAKVYHFTYQTKNLVNGKTYVGVHSTNDLNDGYLGSGKVLKQAIRKYGKSNFAREILSFYDSKDEAYNEEKHLVDNNWVISENNYNQCIGGEGGVKWRPFGELNPQYGKTLSEEHVQKISKSMKGMDAPWKKLPKSPESNKKRSDNCPNKQKVYQYDLKGNFIMEHESVAACSKHLDAYKTSVSRVINGRRNSLKGFLLSKKPLING